MLHFIINPKAKSRLGMTIWKELKEYLNENKIDYKEYLTKGPGYATKAAMRLSAEHAPCTIVALGGDGTLNEVVNGLSNLSQVTLAYIPVGSGNDFANSMNLPANALDNLKQILEPSDYLYLDYGLVSYGENLKHQNRFIVSSGMGFDAGVCYEILQSSIKTVLNKLKLGQLTYTVIGLKQIFTTPYANCELLLDNERAFSFEHLFFISIHNVKYEGGGFMFCPEATPTDGSLNICVADSLSRISVPALLPAAKKGKHIHNKHIQTFSFQEAFLKADIPLYLHTDGEICAAEESVKHTVAKFEVSKDKIKFIAVKDKISS